VKDLFYRTLICNRVQDNPNFVERSWLISRVERELSDPDCRFVVVTGEPGTGKTTLMATLADRHPSWGRYFVRSDSITPLSGDDPQSVLLTVGLQLATLRPDLFLPDTSGIVVSQTVETVGREGRVVGVRIADLTVSPFHQTAVLAVQQDVTAVHGELTGIDVGQATLEPHLLTVDRLFWLALLAPAETLAQKAPTEQIVVLIDALDGIGQQVGPRIVDWLTNLAELPANLRFVVTCRTDADLLALLRVRQQHWVRPVAINANSDAVKDDINRYLTTCLERQTVSRMLSERGIVKDSYRARLLERAEGNFQYAATFIRALEQAAADVLDRQDPSALESLLDLDLVPSRLAQLYGFFLTMIKHSVDRSLVEIVDDVGRPIGWAPAWQALYEPVLGVLTVAQEPLTAAQVSEFAGLRVTESWLGEALSRLRQFLERVDSRYAWYHSSLSDYLTDRRNETWYRDPVEWHRRVLDRIIAAHQSLGTWLQMDMYALHHAATHAVACGRLDVVLGDLSILMAAEGNGLLRNLLRSTSERGRQLAEIYMSKFNVIRNAARPDRAAHLELAAQQVGAEAIANEIAALDLTTWWSPRWLHWHKRSPTRVIVSHGNQVKALACTEFEGRLVAVSAGDGDGALQVHDVQSGGFVRELPVVDVRNIITLACGVVDGQQVVTMGYQDGVIALASLTTGTVLSQRDDVHSHSVTALTMVDVGGEPVMISADDECVVRALYLSSGALVDSLHGIEAVRTCYSNPTNEDYVTRIVALSTDGKLEDRTTRPLFLDIKRVAGRRIVASACGIRVHVHDLFSGATVCDIPADHSHGSVLAITLLVGRGDDLGAVAVGFESHIRVYSLADGSMVSELRLEQGAGLTALSSVEFEGMRLVMYGDAVSQLRVWNPFDDLVDHDDNVGERSYVTTLRPAANGADPAVFAADSINLVSSVIRMPHGTFRSSGHVRLYNADSGQEIDGFALSLHNVAGITAFTVTDDAELAMGGLMSGTIYLFATRTQEQRVLPLPGTSSVMALEYAKIDDRDVFFASSMGGSQAGVIGTPGLIFQLDVRTGELIRQYQTAGGGWPLKLRVLSSERLLLYNEWSGDRIEFIDLRNNGEHLAHVNPGHSSKLTAFTTLATNGDLTLISGDEEGTVRFTNSRTGHTWGFIYMGARIIDIAIVHGRIGISTTSGIAMLDFHP
jgi:WD40 repeat protein